MKLIVGLGNPGREYRLTRHNAGRLLVEWIADQERLKFKADKKIRMHVSAPLPWGEGTMVAYPDCYMNLSGGPVKAAVRQYGLRPEQDLLILVDDLALPFGRLRLRTKGSDGGHNGLRSIAGELLTGEFARLRVGIGHPSQTEEAAEPKDYVLAPFDPSEQTGMAELMRRGYEACRLWASEPPEKAMSAVNAFQI